MSLSQLDESGLQRLVHAFYQKVRQDELLSPVFERVLHDQWEVHLPRMVDFWCTFVLGQKRFTGNVYGKHMVLQDVRREHLLRWLTLWHIQLTELFTPQAAQPLSEAAQRIARSLWMGYFGTDPEWVCHPATATSPLRWDVLRESASLNA
jgi:hemoglobin